MRNERSIGYMMSGVAVAGSGGGLAAIAHSLSWWYGSLIVVGVLLVTAAAVTYEPNSPKS